MSEAVANEAQAMQTMRAFHSDPAVKEKYLNRVQAHAAADELIKGTYWENGKGCAIGCTIEGSDHMRYEMELGIPVTIAHLEDAIFERLPYELAMTWPERVLRAIQVGADLSLVIPRFLMWLMVDLEQYATKFPDVLLSLRQVRGLWERVVLGGEVGDGEWEAAGAAGAAEAARGAAEAAWIQMSEIFLTLLSEAPVP